MCGLKVSGRKEELVARVFAAKEKNVQPIKPSQEVEMEVHKVYVQKLILNYYVIPDPFHLDNWRSEVNGICLWPNISLLII